jgi:protoporphyrinogen oxidase
MNEQQYNFSEGTWLYIEDGDVEMLFRFSEFSNKRWTTYECYQVIDGEVYINKGKFVITTNQEVVEADGSKIDEILALAKQNDEE